MERRPGSLGLGKLIFLGVISIVLCLFGPLLIFAPIPLTMALLLYGRVKTAILVALMSICLGVISSGSPAAGYLIVLYLLSWVFSLLVGEIIERNLSPGKGILGAGIVLVLSAFFILGLYSLFSAEGLEGELREVIARQFDAFKSQSKDFLSGSGEDAKALKELLSKPSDVAKEIIQWLPAFVVITSFGGLWICLGVVLKNALIWSERYPQYPYQLDDLFGFRVPDFFVWPLILGLALFLADKHIFSGARVVGGNILYCLGVFYFFQGFGIMSAFLTHINIGGILRNIIIITTVVIGLKMLVLVGVFDMWFNFRKFFIKGEGT